VGPWLKAEFEAADPWIIRSWDILGQPESEVARRVESRLQNCPYEKGYRVHLPYVEFKLCYFRSEENADWINEADLCFADLVVRKDQPDVAEEFIKTLSAWTQSEPQASSIHLEDAISMGYLPHRLNNFQELLRVVSVSYQAQRLDKSTQQLQETREDVLQLRVGLTQDALPNQEAKCSLAWRGQLFETKFGSIYSSSLLQERERHYFIEQSMMFWTESLRTLEKHKKRK
jgi:hypothetical protein